jgi:hypothetical protein
VQLLDHLDHPLEDYTASVTESGVHQVITWPKPLPKDTRIALRVNFPEKSPAKIFAVYAGDAR